MVVMLFRVCIAPYSRADKAGAIKQITEYFSRVSPRLPR